MSQRNYPCEFCDTELPQEKKSVSLTRTNHGQWFIFENVPAWVCPNCGHRYFDAETVREMEKQMQEKPDKARIIEAWAISLK